MNRTSDNRTIRNPDNFMSGSPNRTSGFRTFTVPSNFRPLAVLKSRTTHSPRNRSWPILLLSFSDLDNRELACWRSLELIDTLIVLAEGGHSQTVKELFAVPQAHCPGTNSPRFWISANKLSLKHVFRNKAIRLFYFVDFRDLFFRRWIHIKNVRFYSNSPFIQTSTSDFWLCTMHFSISL